MLPRRRGAYVGIIALVSGVNSMASYVAGIQSCYSDYATEDQTARKYAPSRVARRHQTWMSYMDVTNYLDYWNLVKNNPRCSM